MPSQLGTTVIEHLLTTQKAHPEATGSFTRLLTGLIVAAKIISREVNKAGLVDILGYAGRENIQGEQVQKLDEFAHRTIVQRMYHTGELCAMASEEDPDIIHIPEIFPKGNYVLIFDPLDGSSNIDVNVSIGTIFSIFRRKTPKEADPTLEDLLQKGSRQAAAGYIIYGSSTMMVYTSGSGVHGFTLLPSIGEFLLSHENIQIPSRGKTFSVNEGNYEYWTEEVQNAVKYFKMSEGTKKKSYSGRYVGSLVADFHRNLLHGGIFMYPPDKKDPKKPLGKLRLMCECNPLAFVVEQAGGYASTGFQRILDLDPKELHQRVPLYIGSKDDVLMAEKYIKGACRP